MPPIKFWKRLTNFMISISLSKKFCCQNLITSIKVINMTGHSSKSNKLRNINAIVVERGTSPSKNRIFTISKSKSSRLSKILVLTKPSDIDTVMCLSIGTPKNNKFSICSKWKFIIFRCPNIWAHNSLNIMCLNIGTPNNHHFPFGTNGKVVVLGVPILKHFRVNVNPKMRPRYLTRWPYLTEVLKGK